MLSTGSMKAFPPRSDTSRLRADAGPRIARLGNAAFAVDLSDANSSRCVQESIRSSGLESRLGQRIRVRIEVAEVVACGRVNLAEVQPAVFVRDSVAKSHGRAERPRQ